MSNTLKSFDFFGMTAGLHFGNFLSRDKGKSSVYKTEIGGIFGLICIAAFFAAFG